jgi:hypothetical protein
MPEGTALQSRTLILEDGGVHSCDYPSSIGFAEMGIALHYIVPQGTCSLLRPLENGILSQNNE